jgi:hypothetical protein
VHRLHPGLRDLDHDAPSQLEGLSMMMRMAASEADAWCQPREAPCSVCGSIRS